MRRDLTAVLRAAQRGDDTAFAVLYRTIQPGLLRSLERNTGADAEDVAAEVWLAIVRNLASFEGDYDRFRAWVAMMSRFRVLDRRRARRRALAEAPLERLPAEPVAPGDMEEELAALDSMLRLIAHLPRPQAQAVLLRVVIGLDSEVTGQVLGKSAGAVRSLTHRGLRRLAQRLAGTSLAYERYRPESRS
ncbi:MAG TPA: RNA polymerase sigma factor [Streptosporangiaceae bacterium]